MCTEIIGLDVQGGLAHVYKAVREAKKHGRRVMRVIKEGKW